VIGPATTDYVTRKFGAMKPADIGLSLSGGRRVCQLAFSTLRA